MKKNTSILFLFGLILVLTGCQGKTNYAQEGKEIKFDYAELVKMTEYDGFRKLEIKNPWDTTRLLQTYLLVDKTKDAPTNLPDGVVLRTPLEKSAVFTTVHCSAIEEFGAVNAIAGVTDLEYVSNTIVAELAKSGKIADFGSGMTPDIEKIITVAPDAILLSPFKNSGGHGELDKTGIPIFECADYMESEPLGRAEWIRVYGMLFGKESIADSIFSDVANTYTEIEKKRYAIENRMYTVGNKMHAKEEKKHTIEEKAGHAMEEKTGHVKEEKTGHAPSLLYGMEYNGTWYVAGGKSYMSKMFASAGADYLFAETDHAGSKPFALESVYDKGCDADVWLFLYSDNMDKTYKDLEKYSNFKSYKTGKIYGCNTTKSHYYDEIPFHPERLLKDLSIIFNSEAEGNLIYYHNLAKEGERKISIK